MNYHWNWGIFWEVSPDGAHTYLVPPEPTATARQIRCLPAGAEAATSPAAEGAAGRSGGLDVQAACLDGP